MTGAIRIASEYCPIYARPRQTRASLHHRTHRARSERAAFRQAIRYPHDVLGRERLRTSTLDCFRPRDGRVLAPGIHASGRLGSSREARRRSKAVRRRTNSRFGSNGRVRRLLPERRSWRNRRLQSKTAICAKRPAGVDVNRTFWIALCMSQLGGEQPLLQRKANGRNSAQRGSSGSSGFGPLRSNPVDAVALLSSLNVFPASPWLVRRRWKAFGRPGSRRSLAGSRGRCCRGLRSLPDRRSRNRRG
jgi:hypothetical protein